MAYGEFLSIVNNNFLTDKKYNILEIGIELGTLTIPIIKDIADFENFSYYGIDIDLKKSMLDTVKDIECKASVTFVEQSSLVELPKLLAAGDKFDLILIDGDHNYYTVGQELKLVEQLIKNDSIIILDDYFGPWSNIDYWYSQHVASQYATPKQKTIKHGVKPAVDDWLAKHKEFEIFALYVDNNVDVLLKYPDKSGKLQQNNCHGVLLKRK